MRIAVLLLAALVVGCTQNVGTEVGLMMPADRWDEQCGDIGQDINKPTDPTSYPVRVVLNENSVSAHDAELMMQAVDALNASFGFEVLVAVSQSEGTDNEPNTITIDTKPVHDGSAVGMTYYYGAGRSLVRVETSNTEGGLYPSSDYPDWSVVSIAEHEMLHGLGLDHEEDVTSLMNPQVGSKSKLSHHSFCKVWRDYIHAL